jgi:hypothetical protein
MRSWSAVLDTGRGSSILGFQFLNAALKDGGRTTFVSWHPKPINEELLHGLNGPATFHEVGAERTGGSILTSSLFLDPSSFAFRELRYSAIGPALTDLMKSSL